MGKRKGWDGSNPLLGEDGTDDVCFSCMDGGKLLICEYSNCTKAYHRSCLKKKDAPKSHDKFICRRHTCFICKKPSSYQCLCCPNASVCCSLSCKNKAQFVIVRESKGLCMNCITYVVLIETNADVSDGVKVDFDNPMTYEFFFKRYWKALNEKEGLTLDELQKAGDYLNIHVSKKAVYAGWGSDELIEFLESMGKDTSKSLNQLEAAEAVQEYIKQKGCPQEVVTCDDKLRSLFKKSKIKYKSIFRLLEGHIAANASSDAETLANSKDQSASFMKKKTRTMNSESSALRRSSEGNRGSFAALVPDNIDLILLKKSLLTSLLKQPETFESKVVGCFVRVRIKDPFHETGIMLGRVTGISKSSDEYEIGNTSTNMLLCIFDMFVVKISKLVNGDTRQVECEDLHLLARKEHFKRLTVAELEDKERSVHWDIVNHRINAKIERLGHMFDLANDKGRHDEKKKLIEDLRLLKTEAEKKRLLDEVPRVIPDVEDKDSDILSAKEESRISSLLRKLEESAEDGY